MMETHGMLRNDTSALFERLREANVLLQEVLGGATENLAQIETSLSARVVEFVTAMNDIGERSGAISDRFEKQMKAFLTGTSEVLQGICQAAEKFDAQGKDACRGSRTDRRSNQRTEEVMADRRERSISVVNQIDSKVGDLDHRLKRFSGLLQETFEAAEGRARDIARVLAESSTEAPRRSPISTNWCARPATRSASAPREALNSIYEQATGETASMFRQVSERFVEIVRPEARNERRDAARNGDDAHRAAPRHPRTAAGDRRERRADAPRDRRTDRRAGRAQSHRRAARPRSDTVEPVAPRRAGRGAAAPSAARRATSRSPPTAAAAERAARPPECAGCAPASVPPRRAGADAAALPRRPAARAAGSPTC